MANLANDEVIWHYVGLNLNGGLNGRKLRGGSVRVRRQDGREELIYQRYGGGSHGTAWGPAPLARWFPKRRMFLLNGDGFSDNWATQWQTYLREAVQTVSRILQLPEGERRNAIVSAGWQMRVATERIFQMSGGGAVNGEIDPRLMQGFEPVEFILLPFAAIEGAEIDPDSIIPVSVDADRFEWLWHRIPEPPVQPDTVPEKDDLPKGWNLVESPARGENFRTYQTTKEGHRFTFTAQKTPYYQDSLTGETRTYPPYPMGNYVQKLKWAWWGQATVWGADERGQGAARNFAQRSAVVIREPETLRDADDIEREVGESEWGWAERVHRLGSSVFTARTSDARRHRFLSAFDELELAAPMYYLAQLPDSSKAASYAEAVRDLAPAIVHESRRRGLTVYRQGDIFAIETDLTDEQVYEGCRSRVRRRVAMFHTDEHYVRRIIRGEAQYPEPLPGEIRERIDCPCRCGHKRWVGFGDRARRSLSIYRTGHTADEVVVSSTGATFGRGVLRHDPQIEDATRRREHVDVPLFARGTQEEDWKWFLMVRNTVPRRRRRRSPEEREEENG